MLLHALGESVFDWRWVLLALARTHCVYALYLPGFGYSAKPYAEYSPAFFARFVGAYLDALGVERAALVGNSIGGLAALRLALSEPERVSALGLVASAGLGREVTYALRLPTLPGYGEATVTWGKTPLGAFQRAWSRVPLLFGRPERVPAEWVNEADQDSAAAGFYGGDDGRPACPSRPGRAAGGPSGSTSPLGNADAYHLGKTRPSVSLRPRAKSGLLPPTMRPRANP